MNGELWFFSKSQKLHLDPHIWSRRDRSHQYSQLSGKWRDLIWWHLKSVLGILVLFCPPPYRNQHTATTATGSRVLRHGGLRASRTATELWNNQFGAESICVGANCLNVALTILQASPLFWRKVYHNNIAWFRTGSDSRRVLSSSTDVRA